MKRRRSTDPTIPLIALMPWAMTLGVMRSLGPRGVPVHGLPHRLPSPSRLSRYSAGTIRLGRRGRPHGDPAQILEELLAAGRALGEGAVLLHGSDDWAHFLAEHREPLRHAFRFALPATALVRELISKEGQRRLATAHGVPSPPLLVPRDAAHAAQLAATARYPLMVKPLLRRPDVVAKAVATDPDSLLRHYRALEESPARPNVGFQDYVPGRDEDDWLFTGYFDAGSRCLAAFTGQKLRQHPAHAGHCCLGVARRNQALVDVSVRFLRAIGYHGIVEMGYRFDRREGVYQLLDVNPRLGGAFRLSVDPEGRDVVQVAYLDLTGRPVSTTSATEGRVWIKEHEDLVAFREYQRSDGMRARDWLRSLLAVDEATTLSVRDPLPSLATLAVLADETFGGRLGRGPSSAADR